MSVNENIEKFTKALKELKSSLEDTGDINYQCLVNTESFLQCAKRLQEPLDSIENIIGQRFTNITINTIVFRAYKSKNRSKIRYSSNDIKKVARALALRIDPYIAYRIYADVFNGSKREELLNNINWSRLCCAWRLFDRFRREKNLSLLSEAYSKLRKGVPELYMILAEWIMYEKIDNKGIGSMLKECLQKCISYRIAPDVMRCLNNVLKTIGLYTRKYHYYYDKCREQYNCCSPRCYS